MCAIYSGPFCNFPQPREAHAFYAASIAYQYIVQSLAFGSLASPIRRARITAYPNLLRAGRSSDEAEAVRFSRSQIVTLKR
jgi:hypothetical protein